MAAIKMVRHANWKGLRKFGVTGAAMITFAAIFHHQFPVGVFNKHAFISQFRVPEIVRRGIGRQLLTEVINRRRRIGEANEDGASNALNCDWFQAMFAFVEIIGHPVRGK